ncbi:hypothetical protein SAMN04489761_2387 [Tenacibaculum sp. MAR_2009_124]|uniref:hypothetical protein n=1 Tax=Tenacibaculum sp. MAR_2009_124 TaxID=1250059 RepID=UPI000898B305|nr:hypothetical protein [Tenacibaculum sp. MAR_2009_124]SEC21155.1 hypothetical protein SAMN04489761_2387 [Tenacibaculum sp. MAR_2009_124]
MKETYEELDNELIFKEQKQVLRNVFDQMDMSKVVFIGGIADYINLREHYHLVINDIDLAYENEEDIAHFLKNYDYKKYQNRFYNSLNNEVLVIEVPFGGKCVHFDFFQRDLKRLDIDQSYLLGEKVHHTSFNEMKNFHNQEIGKQTSRMQKEKYEWKRLYKHSIKASLYNAVCYNVFTKKERSPLRCALTR